MESCSNQENYDYGCPCCEFAEPSYGILFPCVVVLVGIIVNFVLIQMHSPFPYAAVMFLIGTALGIIATMSSTGCCNALILSTLQWTQIDSNLLLLTILPGLILRDAMEIQFDIFMLASGQLLLLAYPMVLVGTILTGVAVYFCVPWFDWPWSLTFTLGSILGSTDPIAVASVLKSLGAPPRLQLHLSGESTLNDGSAMVFFNVFSQTWISSFSNNVGDISVARGFALFFQNALGGFTIGLCFAVGLLFTLYYLDKRMEPEYDILQAVAAVTASYLSYYVADQLLQMSGVTASVTCAVLSKAFGRGMIQDGPGMIRYLSLMEFLLNTLLFALGGVVWGSILVRNMVHDNISFSGTTEWLWLFVLYLLASVIRAIQVAFFYPVFRRIGLRSSCREAVFLAFAGMRGAVGIALALSLYRRTLEETSSNDTGDRDEIQSLASGIFFLSGGVSLCTLLINGTLAPWVLQWLKLIQPSDRRATLDLFEVSAEEFVNKHYVRLRKFPRFRRASFSIVQNHVPFLTDDSSADTDVITDPTADPYSPSYVGTKPTATAKGIKPRHIRLDSNPLDASDIEACSASFDRFSEAVKQFQQQSTTSEPLDQNVNMALYDHIRHIFLDMVYDAFLERLQEGNMDSDQHPKKKQGDFQKLFFQDGTGKNDTDTVMETFTERGLAEWPLNEMERFWWNRLIQVVRRLLRKINGKSPREKEIDHAENSQAAMQYHAIRPTLQRTVAFIGARRRSEERFIAYMDHVVQKYDKKMKLHQVQKSSTEESLEGNQAVEQTDSMVDPVKVKEAVEMVLQESRKQTALALEKLHSYNPDDLRNVQSHVMAAILLKRLTRFIGSLVQDETVTATEAQVYLNKINEQKEKLKHCFNCDVGTRAREALETPPVGKQK